MNKPTGTIPAPGGTNVPPVCTTTGLDSDVCFGACCCPATPAGTAPSFAETVAATLHRAAAAYRTGEIRWGRDAFIGIGNCRCALGAITYAVDPTGEGAPHWIADPDARNVAEAAADALATYLVHELNAVPAYDGQVLDVVETVGNWNDESARSAGEVIAALDAAAEHAA